jgi:hypothetical protein
LAGFQGLRQFYEKSLTLKRQQNSKDFLILNDDFLEQSLRDLQPFNSLPCSSILKEFEKFRSKKSSHCPSCLLKQWCHPLQFKASNSALQNLYQHLLCFGFCQSSGLTQKGKMALQFRYEGALVIGEMASQLTSSKEVRDFLIGLSGFALSTKKQIPFAQGRQRFLAFEFFKQIDRLYPEEVFPDLYEIRKDSDPTFLFYHSGALPIIDFWLRPKVTWTQMTQLFCRRGFLEGDLLMLISRYLSFLLALSQSSFKLLSKDALNFYNLALRDEVKKNLIPFDTSNF